MRFSCYEWNPKRFHPDFNGIASRYSQHKKQRLARQRQRQQLESDHAYTINLDHSLDKALQSKTLELFRLQQAKQRHLEDLEYKQRLHEERKQQIENLREKNLRQRAQRKKNIEEARNTIYSRNENSRILLKRHLTKMNAKLEHLLDKQLQTKGNKYKEIKDEEDMSLMKVNNYYRQKNQQSLAYYLQRIREEHQKKKQQVKQIKKLEKNMQNLNKNVQTKKQSLTQIQQQIYKLKTNVRTLKSGTKIRRKTMRQQTDGSELERPDLQSKDSLRKLINPQDLSDLM